MSSTDDPQQTPHPDNRTKDSINAKLAVQVYLLREQSVKTEAALTKVAEQLAFLTSATTANTNELSRLASEVRKLSKADETLREALGGVREGMRNTNQRLRVVEGHGEGGLEP